jgi:hypothetical protein
VLGSGMVRPVAWVLLSVVLLSGCSSNPPPETPAPPASASPVFTFAPPPSEEDRELLDAQIKLTQTVGLGLLVSAAIFVTTKGRCPSLEELVESGLIAQGLSSRDVWGTPYRITCPNGGSPVVTSAGPDLAFDTPDDLNVEGE